MALPDALDQDLRLLGTKLEGDVGVQEVVGWRGVGRPHRHGPLRHVSVVVEFGLELADGGCPLRVLGEAEVELSDAPSIHAAPVDLAGHPLQISARDAADNPLVRSQVAETVDESGLVLAQPAGEIRRRDALRFEAFEDPWQEDEVAESRLDGGGAWAEHVREGVAYRAQTQHVEGAGLFERAEQRSYALACGCIEIEPADRGGWRVSVH